MMLILFIYLFIYLFEKDKYANMQLTSCADHLVFKKTKLEFNKNKMLQ